jgi:hypothetical protein
MITSGRGNRSRITKLPKREHETFAWRAAIEAAHRHRQRETNAAQESCEEISDHAVKRILIRQGHL